MGKNALDYDVLLKSFRTNGFRPKYLGHSAHSNPLKQDVLSNGWGNYWDI